MGWYSGILGTRTTPGLIPLDSALEALGEDGTMGREYADVPLDGVVGSVGRAYDFDHEFRLVNKSLRGRWQRVATAVEAGFEPPPVDLIRLGDLYFVADGHHRVSVARAQGRVALTARVLRVCTIAYAMCCIRLAHLPSKAAERQFLERVPLPDDVRMNLWLDHPADWMRLADAAEAWGYRRLLEGRPPVGPRELAEAWWTDEVMPALERLRAAGAGLDLRDVQLYATALAIRDRLGRQQWSADLVDHVTGART